MEEIDQLESPQLLADGLIMRRATLDDMDAIAAFNQTLHGDPDGKDDNVMVRWVESLMGGTHPTTTAADFTVVIDPAHDSRLVSTLCLIPQTWSYEGIAFEVGRLELVGTLKEYRRRGLIRRQMTVFHAWCAARQLPVQAITGVPWFYRQFDYGMALDLYGRRRLPWSALKGPKKKEPVADAAPLYRLRAATTADLPRLAELYEKQGGYGPVRVERDNAAWQHLLAAANSVHFLKQDFRLIERLVDDRAVGYVNLLAAPWMAGVGVTELIVEPGISLRSVALFLAQTLKPESEALLKKWERPLTDWVLAMGLDHPVYEALGQSLQPGRSPYAYYMRVTDLIGFLRLITPALERRLADSILVGHNGRLRLTDYRHYLALTFDNGRLTDIAPYEPDVVEDADLALPFDSLLQALFGRRSLDHFLTAHADCFARDEAYVLHNILFPHQSSQVICLS